MAFVVNRAGYDLSLKDERGNNISIPANNKAYNISDFVYFKYKELLHLLIPKNIPVVIPKQVNAHIETINMNKAPDVIQENISMPTFDKIIEIKIEPEPIKENVKPLQGVSISENRRNTLLKKNPKMSRKKKEVVEEKITEEQKIDA